MTTPDDPNSDINTSPDDTTSSSDCSFAEDSLEEPDCYRRKKEKRIIRTRKQRDSDLNGKC